MLFLEKRKNVAEAFDHSEKDKQPEQGATRKPEGTLEIQKQQLSPRPSFWPLTLAVALVVTGIGVMIHPVVLGCGIVLTIAAIIGWALEKQ